MNPLFLSLVDDAGLAPPTSLPMNEALLRHAIDAAEGSPVLTHRFLCPASRLDELRRHDPGPLRLGVILDTGEPPDLRGFTVELIETLPPPSALPFRRIGPDAWSTIPEPGILTARRIAPWAPPTARIFVEVPRSGDFPRVGRGVGLKIRCGGPRPEDFPSTHRLGAFIRHCVRDGVPFKATAGLHRAVRHPDPSFGVYRHGFLNLLLAVCAALTERDPVQVLEIGDPGELVQLAEGVPVSVARRARELFVSYASCCTAAPLEDLAELGLIDPVRKAAKV